MTIEMYLRCIKFYDRKQQRQQLFRYLGNMLINSLFFLLFQGQKQIQQILSWNTHFCKRKDKNDLNIYVCGGLIIFPYYKYSIMFIKKFMRDFILRSDMFAASTTLRYGGQSSYQTIFGGCFSIILVIAFGVIFYTSFYEVLTKVNISSSLQTENDPYSEDQITGIKLAIGIEGVDFSQSQRYFGLVLVEKIRTKSPNSEVTRFIDLQTCNQSDWQDEGPNFGLLFKAFNMDQMLCPAANEELTLKGFAGSQQWISYYVMVEQCKNASSVSWTCHDRNIIDTYFANHFLTNDYFKVQLYIVDTIISPSKQVPVEKTIEEQIFVTFSQNSGSRGKVKIGSYNISTDNSIWPNSDINYHQGHYITSYRTNSIQLFSTHYVRIQIEKASTVFNVVREHDKLDNMLSYVGGLFSLLFAFIYFFIGSYNQYRYEVAISEGAFTIDQTGRKIREKNFGFLRYLQYCLYDWMRTFNIKVNWKKMQEINSAREEAIQQMDVQYLIKKIQRFQLMNKYLMGEHNLICANLSRPPTLQQVKKMRKITQFYDKIIRVQNEEETIVKGILGMMDKKQNKIENQSGEESLQKIDAIQGDIDDYDSQDEAAQEAICQSLEILEKQTGKTTLTKQILGSIPTRMLCRLRNQRDQAVIQKKLLVIQNIEQDSMEQGSTPQNLFSSFFAKKEPDYIN